jgi:hypothetical protein
MTEFRIFVKTLAKEADTATVRDSCERLKKYFDDVCKKRKSFPLTNPKLFTHSICTLEPNTGDIDSKRGDVLVYITTSDKSPAKTHFKFVPSDDIGGVNMWTPDGVLTEVFWDKLPSVRQSDWFKRAIVLANMAFHEIGHNKYTELFEVKKGENHSEMKRLLARQSDGMEAVAPNPG